MTNKKYELLSDDTILAPNGQTLFRIRALVAIGEVAAPGDLGGYIASEANLVIYGDAWITDNARVSGFATVTGNALVSGNALVFGNAQVSNRSSLGWFSQVGSENGTLTWALTDDGGVWVSRGCFAGSLDDFAAAVEETHGDSKTGKEYRLLIEFIRLRSSGKEAGC